MSLKIYGVALGLCFFLLSSRLAFCQQVELVVDTTYNDFVRIGDDFLFLSDDGNTKYKDGVITDFMDFDIYAVQHKDQDAFGIKHDFYLLVQKMGKTYVVNSSFQLLPELGIDLGDRILKPYDPRKDIIVVDNLVSYFRNDSVFINDLYRPYEEFVDTGSEMVFKNRNFLLIQKGDYTIVYSVKNKKKAKLKGSISRVNTDNNYLVISAQIKDNGKKEILALDQDFKVVVPKQAGYHYFETNEMVAVFTKKGEPSNNVGRRARSAAPFVINKGNKLRITSNIKEVTLLSNYLTLETIDDTYGLMGFSGQMLTDLSYDEMEGFSKVNSLKRNGVTSLVNKQGKVVFEWPYESAEIILDKYYVLKRKLNDRNFVIDANDNLIIDIDTTGFYTYSGRKEYGAEFIIAKSKLINKLYDCTGKLLSEWKTDTSDYSETRGVITSSNFLVAYDLDMFSTLDLDSVKEINPSGIFRRSHKGKHNNNYSLVNHKGEAITSIHDVIWDQDDGLYVTKTLSGKIGMVRVSY